MSANSHNAKIRKIAEMAIKIIIVLAGCWVLYVKIIKNQDITEMWESVKLSFLKRRVSGTVQEKMHRERPKKKKE